MPCTGESIPRLSDRELRQRDVKAALARLEQALTLGTVKIKIGAQGALAFAGWTNQDRVGLSDACAYRVLQSQGSAAMRQALARAEALAGRKLDTRQVNAGVHSHDGGQTWGKD